MESNGYSNYTLQELYDMYRTIDNEKYPEDARLIYEEMVKREKENKSLTSLASPWIRLGANLIDTILLGLPTLIVFYIVGFQNILNFYLQHGIMSFVYIFIVNQAIYFILNGWLLYSKGQTIGKKLLKIKTVTLENDLPALYKVYGLRYLLNTFIGTIPILGSLYMLIDVLFIFADDRRCLHDHLAGTRVVPE